MKLEYASAIQTINTLKNEVRNWSCMVPNKSWRWSCEVCGDSVRSRAKARFGVTFKDNSFVCHCFNCGYAMPFEAYLKDFHPTHYRARQVEAVKYSRTDFDLSDVVRSVDDDSVLSQIFYVSKFQNPKKWVGYLARRKIFMNKTALRKLYKIHKEHWGVTE